MHVHVYVHVHVHVAHAYIHVPKLAQVSGFHSLSSPPLHPLTSRGERGEERVPSDVMEVP